MGILQCCCSSSSSVKKTRTCLIFLISSSFSLSVFCLYSHLRSVFQQVHFFLNSVQRTRKSDPLQVEISVSKSPNAFKENCSSTRAKKRTTNKKNNSNFYRLKGQSLYSKRPLIQLIQAIHSLGCSVAKMIENNMLAFVFVCVCGKCLHNMMVILRRMAVLMVAHAKPIQCADKWNTVCALLQSF